MYIIINKVNLKYYILCSMFTVNNIVYIIKTNIII